MNIDCMYEGTEEENDCMYEEAVATPINLTNEEWKTLQAERFNDYMLNKEVILNETMPF